MANNSVAANIFLLALLIGGLVAGLRVTKEVFPDSQSDSIVITVNYPGASSPEVERSICLPLEEALTNVEGIDKLRCLAREGGVTFTADLRQQAEISEVLTDTREAVFRIETFPEDARKPIVKQVARRRETVTLVVFGDSDRKTLFDLANRMRDQLADRSDVTEVELSGVPPMEITIEVSPQDLRKYQLTLSGLTQMIRRSSIDLPGGQIKAKQGTILLRTEEKRATAEDLRNIVIRQLPDGGRLTLGQFAKITDGYEDRESRATFDGKNAAMIDVYRIGKETPEGISKAVKDFIKKARSSLPPTFDIAMWNDRSEIFTSRFNLLMRNGLIGLFFIILNLAIFLELSLSFWVAVGIFASFVGALLALYWFGVSINMLSLFGFILVLGIVVDVRHHRGKYL